MTSTKICPAAGATARAGESDQGFRLRRMELADGRSIFLVVDIDGRLIESSGDPA